MASCYFHVENIQGIVVRIARQGQRYGCFLKGSRNVETVFIINFCDDPAIRAAHPEMLAVENFVHKIKTAAGYLKRRF